MSSYRFGKQGTATATDSSKFKTFIKVTFFTLLLLVPVIIYVIVTTLPPSPVTGRTVDKGYFDPYTTISTEWFSFRVEKTWQEVPDITTKDKVYFYREMQGSNQQGLLAVYVNSEPMGSESFYSNVVPVEISDGSSLIADEMQPHCDTASNPVVKDNHIATMAGTSFVCWAGGPILHIVAGEVGGSEKLTMKRENGDTAIYTISYTNLAFTPNTSTFSRVLNTFKSR